MHSLPKRGSADTCRLPNSHILLLRSPLGPTNGVWQLPHSFFSCAHMRFSSLCHVMWASTTLLHLMLCELLTAYAIGSEQQLPHSPHNPPCPRPLRHHTWPIRCLCPSDHARLPGWKGTVVPINDGVPPSTSTHSSPARLSMCSGINGSIPHILPCC